MTQAQNHADYGQDAPYVVRNLLLSSVIGLIVWAAIYSGIWTGSVLVTLGGKNITLITSPPATCITQTSN